nr:hypothetical protein [uncultured Desulfobulbus sp.]
MPKQISQNDLERIVQTVGQFPDGVGIEKILSELNDQVPRRTLQRHLALLVQQKRLIKEGLARSSRYLCVPAHFPDALEEIAEPNTSALALEDYIPLSQAGEECKKAIKKPIQHRQPVGYNRNFLDLYNPNSTFYLPNETRDKFFEMGRSPDEQRVAGTYARHIFNRLLIDLSWN